jgi:hypothetical protein
MRVEHEITIVAGDAAQKSQATSDRGTGPRENCHVTALVISGCASGPPSYRAFALVGGSLFPTVAVSLEDKDQGSRCGLARSLS